MPVGFTTSPVLDRLLPKFGMLFPIREPSFPQTPFGKSRKGGRAAGAFLIQAVNGDRTEPWPDGQDRQEDQCYPSDLTDEEWGQIAPLMPKPGRLGHAWEVKFREVVNAVRYLVCSGCGRRMLPAHFGPWQTVYSWFRELARRFLFQTIHDLALMVDRERAGREASPSAGVIDSQTVKAPASGAQTGYDVGKKIVGRKRHIAVDTDGRLLMVNLTPADISDSAGAQTILDGIRKRWPCGSQARVRRRRPRSAEAHGQGRLP